MYIYLLEKYFSTPVRTYLRADDKDIGSIVDNVGDSILLNQLRHELPLVCHFFSDQRKRVGQEKTCLCERLKKTPANGLAAP